MTWILILYFYAGAMASGDSVTVTNVPGFTTQESCMQAGEATKPLVSGSFKNVRYVCVKQ